MRGIAPAIVSAAAALCLGGCLPSFALRTGEPIGDNQVKTIVPGATSKSELLERFGAPAAIVARGEVVVTDAPSTWAAPSRAQTSCAFEADTFFELFPKVPGLDEYRRIYYFRHVVSRKMIVFMLLALHEGGGTTSNRLWVLVNEKSGIVEDFAFRKSGATTVFGKPRIAAPR